jgi:8-oxo-dGTP diphosphatase
VTITRRTRVAAYAICLRDDEVLLTRFVSRDGTDRHWTLPGGGIEYGEDPSRGVVREVAEETGYRAEVDALLGVDSRPRRQGWTGHEEDVHHLGVFYAVRIVGGELRHEVDGSTDQAAWVALADVPDLRRASLVDVGLRLERERPSSGHVDSELGDTVLPGQGPE